MPPPPPPPTHTHTLDIFICSDQYLLTQQTTELWRVVLLFPHHLTQAEDLHDTECVEVSPLHKGCRLVAVVCPNPP